MQAIAPKDLPYEKKLGNFLIDFEELNDGHYIAEHNSVPIGSFNLEEQEDGSWLADDIAVADAYRRLGIAKEFHLIALHQLGNYYLPNWKLINGKGMSDLGKLLYDKLYDEDLLTDSQRKEIENFNDQDGSDFSEEQYDV